MWKIRELQDKVTNVVMNYTEIEAKVREATNDDSWGPHGTVMAEIARYTFTYEHFPEVMSMLWKRMLHENKKNWRRIYKALLLLTYLVKNGSERVVTNTRDHIYDLRQLENFNHTDEFGRDQGINIRHKVKDLVELVQDDERLKQERKRAKKNRDKYKGVSNDDYTRSYSDRYDSEPRGTDQFDEFNGRTTRKSRIREWRERAGSYGEYKDKDSEEEEAEEAEEEKDKNSTSSPDSSRNPTPKLQSKPSRTIDLGAAANFGKLDIAKNKSEKPVQSAAQSTVSSSRADLVDLFSGPSGTTLTSQPFQAPSTSVVPSSNDDSFFADFASAPAEGGTIRGSENVNFSNGTPEASDDFGDFAAFRTGSPPQSNLSDDAFFSGFESNTTPQSNQITVSQSVPQNASQFFSAPQSQSVVNPPLQPQSTVLPGLHPQLGPLTQPGLQPQPGLLSQTSLQPQPSLQSQPGLQPQASLQPQPVHSALMNNQFVSGAMQGQIPNTQLFVQPQPSQQPMLVKPQTMTPSKPLLPSGKSSSSVMAEGTPLRQKVVKSTTWSNSPVDISLDNLSPMSHKDKPAQPSMNELYSNQQQVPSAAMGSYNMPQQGMYPMGMPSVNTNYPVMGMAAPQINMVGPNMSQMAVSSNVPMMPMTNRAMGMMQPRPMGQMPSFGTSAYSTYKGVS